MGMYPRVGAPLVPIVLSPVLGHEHVSSKALSALGLPSGMRLKALDERVWVEHGDDAVSVLAEDVLGCVRRRWSKIAHLQTMVSFRGKSALELELSVRARNGLLRNDWARHKTLPDRPLRDISVCELASIPWFGAQSLLDVLSATSGLPRCALAQAVRALEREPWSGRVSRNDPRLGNLVRALDAEAATAREAAQRSISRRLGPGEERQVMSAINVLRVEGSRLRRLRLDEELQGIVHAVLEPDGSRAVAIARLGLGGAPPVTLDQAGQEAGVTRERVRGIEKRLRGRIAPAGEVWTPALDSVVRVIRHTSPTTSQELHRNLINGALIPDTFSTSSILAATRVFGKQVEIYAEHRLISSRPLPVTRERIHTTAQRLITHWGATTVDAVCAGVREETSLVLPGDLARLLLESQDGFRWLDERRGWFWLRETARNRLLNQIEKITAVAPSVSIADLAEGVARHHRMKGLRLPRHVLARLCEDSGLYERSGDRVLAKPGHPHWEDILGKQEATLVGVLLDHGPVMGRAALEQIAVHEKGVGRHSFILHLGCSPVLTHHAYALYGLRGR